VTRFSLFRIQRVSILLRVLLLLSSFLYAQDDSSETPLGDIARSFHKKPSSQQVIDNDNLSRVMDQVESHRASDSSLRYSIDDSGRSFRVAAPDVSCSLSFSANAQALLSSQYPQLDLPANELIKVDGSAAIDGESLLVSLFNGTAWHVSEVAVALTLLKKAPTNDAAIYYGTAKLVPARDGGPLQDWADRPQKRSDVTFVYRIRAAAPPSATTVFRAPLNVEIGPDQEWHWAIVQVKGYPPEPEHGSIPPGSQAPSVQPEPVDSVPQASIPQMQPN
jgi:hypothetical protein